MGEKPPNAEGGNGAVEGSGGSLKAGIQRQMLPK